MSETDIRIYYSSWDGRTGSHALLRQAARQYCRENEPAGKERVEAALQEAAGNWPEEAALQEAAGKIPVPEETRSSVLCRGGLPCREEKRGESETGNFQFAQAERNSKPYFADRPDLLFSISHSGNWWVCAISGVEMGLDLQEIRQKEEEKLARRFFHPEEVRWLERNGFAQFSRLWAYKESYVKYTGVGLREGLDYFSVITGGSLSGAPDVFQTQLPFQEGFVLVLTVTKEQAGAARQARLRELEGL